MVSDYQGEGIYRVFLFSSPWCALIIARRLVDLRFSPTLCLAVLGCWAMFAGLGSAQAQDFGMWPMILVTAGRDQRKCVLLESCSAKGRADTSGGKFPLAPKWQIRAA